MIMLILDDEHAHQMRTAGMEVKARGADVVIITDKPAVSAIYRHGWRILSDIDIGIDIDVRYR